jgi:hypothetical protein
MLGRTLLDPNRAGNQAEELKDKHAGRQAVCVSHD